MPDQELKALKALEIAICVIVKRVDTARYHVETAEHSLAEAQQAERDAERRWKTQCSIMAESQKTLEIRQIDLKKLLAELEKLVLERRDMMQEQVFQEQDPDFNSRARGETEV